ncbi:MAG: CRISPR-associated endonuclease Cas2 [Candidatus Competibacteraceae bacterium]|nr:CRISPR-associated endonuclease Cas2 [Candidatus Competibacteraceae bacterium]
MFTVISYDVVDDRRRNKVHALLKGYGTRVQYSVFECDLEARHLAAIQQEIRALVDLATDSVRFYFLDTAAVARILVVGIGQVSTDPRYYWC